MNDKEFAEVMSELNPEEYREYQERIKARTDKEKISAIRKIIQQRERDWCWCLCTLRESCELCNPDSEYQTLIREIGEVLTA